MRQLFILIGLVSYAGLAQASDNELICRVTTSLYGESNITEMEKRSDISIPAEGLNQTSITFETGVGISVEGRFGINSAGNAAYSRISFFEKTSKLSFVTNSSTNEVMSEISYPQRLDQDGNITNGLKAECFISPK